MLPSASKDVFIKFSEQCSIIITNNYHLNGHKGRNKKEMITIQITTTFLQFSKKKRYQVQRYEIAMEQQEHSIVECNYW